MKLQTRIFVAGLALAASGFACAQQTLLNVSYDVAREFYKDINAAFVPYYKKQTGKDVKIEQSHAGSSAQARAVADGLDADVVTMNTTTDIEFLADKGVVAKDWAKRFPDNAAPTTSTMLILVRIGNPKGIKDWDDLVKPGVQVVVVNPKTGGNGRYTYLAAWGTSARRAAPTRRPRSSSRSCTRTCRCSRVAAAMRPPRSCSATSATHW
jgi:sulfate transport system substrate-binding protein